MNNDKYKEIEETNTQRRRNSNNLSRFKRIILIIMLVSFFIFVFCIYYINVANSKSIISGKLSSDDTTSKEEIIIIKHIYLNSLKNDINNIKDYVNYDKNINTMYAEFNNIKLTNIIDGKMNSNNFLFIGFISFLTDHIESTDINHGSRKQFSSIEPSKPNTYIVKKIMYNGFDSSNMINTINNISAIVYVLDDDRYLMCDFVRSNNDYLYNYTVYENEEEWSSKVKNTNYKISEFKEQDVYIFNDVIEHDKIFIDAYVKYKLNNYYPNISSKDINNSYNTATKSKGSYNGYSYEKSKSSSSYNNYSYEERKKVCSKSWGNSWCYEINRRYNCTDLGFDYSKCKCTSNCK